MIEWLLGTLFATSALIVLVLAVREPVRRHFGARVAYSLWLLPAARFLMPTLTETVARPVPVRAPMIPAVGVPELSHVVSPMVPVALWVIGALALFITRMMEFRRQRAAILAIATEVGRAGSIRIVTSAAVNGLVAFGIVDRVIAVPSDFELRYSVHERRLALDHELAHHRSGDLIANFLAFVLLCLQWFNPLAWVAHAAFRFDQEAACDARVLDKASPHRGDYGRAIAKAASGRALLFAGALDRQSSLEKRLRCMLSSASASRRVTGRLMVMTALAAALPLTATRAINYVDVPAADDLHEPVPLARIALDSKPAIAPAMQIQSDNNNLAQSVRPQFVTVREQFATVSDQLVDAQHQARDSTQALADQVQAGRDVEQAQRDQAQARSDVEQAHREQAQARRDVEQAQREQAQARRDVQQAQTDHELRLTDAEQASGITLQISRSSAEESSTRGQKHSAPSPPGIPTPHPNDSFQE